MPRAIWIPIAILFAVPGCALTVHEQNDDGRNSPKKDSFAELITAPGQHYPLGTAPAPLTGSIPTAPPAPVMAKQEPKPASAVSPPNPIVMAPPRPDQSQPVADEGILPSMFRPGPGPDTPFLAAARAHQDGRSDFAQEQLRAMPPVNQDILGKLLPAAAKTAVSNLNDPKEAGEILHRIDSAADQLRPRTELRIDALRLCSKIIDFGEYDPIPATAALRPGQVVTLYSEIKGAVPELITVDGETRYLLRFSAAVRIRGNGKLVSETSQPYQRKTRSQPRDVIVGYGFEAPHQTGFYTAELELTDTAGRRAKRSVEFRVDDRK
jgi:hypothetical protein